MVVCHLVPQYGDTILWYNIVLECNVDLTDKASRVTQNKPYRAGQQGCLLLKGQSSPKTPYYALIIPNAFSNLL